MQVAGVLALAILAFTAGSDRGAASRAQSGQAAADWLTTIGLREGSTVADIGSGDGYFSLQLARLVSPNGRVLAVDLDRRALERLAADAKKEGLANIEIIRRDAAELEFQPQSLDAALMVRAYHEFQQYQQVLKGIRTALKPQGRLVIVDDPPSTKGRSRGTQTSNHEIERELVEKEVSDAGFRIIETRDPLRLVRRQRTSTAWLIVAEPVHTN